MGTPATMWVRVIENPDAQTGKMEFVADPVQATALTGESANYFLKTLRDDPKGYEYDVVPTSTRSRFVIKTQGQTWFIRATQKG